MSADNWTTCPVCEAVIMAKHNKKQQKVKDKYGQIPIDEFMALKADADKAPEIPETLREDYNIGVSGEILVIKFRCSCKTCGLKFEYSKQMNILDATVTQAETVNYEGP